MGKIFLYGETKLMAAVEDIGNLFSPFFLFIFFFKSVQRSRGGGLYECSIRPKQLSEINMRRARKTLNMYSWSG